MYDNTNEEYIAEVKLYPMSVTVGIVLAYKYLRTDIEWSSLNINPFSFIINTMVISKLSSCRQAYFLFCGVVKYMAGCLQLLRQCIAWAVTHNIQYTLYIYYTSTQIRNLYFLRAIMYIVC